MKKIILLNICFFVSVKAFSQVNENQTGAWYMYFFNHQFKNSQFGIQGDIQYRDWEILGDKEQLLLRSGVTYKPKSNDIMFTFGLANITNGEFGDSDVTSNENRIYQEALIPQKIAHKFLVTHRFRYEQRFVENQDFRTRYRYNLFINIPFKGNELTVKTFYAAFYNELFINGERTIGNNETVELFDRNRTYIGLGYVLKPTIRFQFGYMQQTTNTFSKGQLQFSMHHNF
ncbi:DUF2490 domain-containing protein [Polaribacter sp. WD7]|uniref:DUF2490 domain-containing protein n=1 Tax=Polaribacter sp. WD7 TaxID=2269061 RepID=UPI000DF3EF33|nr:DUF2490 domain-containing protein [Polaribacter sp. WD7]RCS26525.1 DUF2490 domain-containing protein [Polaribacter sp. WD7]